MDTNLTQKQQKALEAIYNNINSTGFPPTLADLKETLGVSSNQAILKFLDILEKKGCIEREEGQARGIKLTPLGLKILGKERLVPVVGITSAGLFIESFSDAFTSWMPLSKSILQNEQIQHAKDEVFVIQVSGDSMINAGIDDSDMLLVKKSKEFKSGDIVIARTDNGTTVKRFVADGGKRYLKPENPAYNNILIIPGEVIFEGKVILNLSKVA